VLPRIAQLAQNRLTIILLKPADALDDALFLRGRRSTVKDMIDWGRLGVRVCWSLRRRLAKLSSRAVKVGTVFELRISKGPKRIVSHNRETLILAAFEMKVDELEW